jgi:hypothetical protein
MELGFPEVETSLSYLNMQLYGFLWNSAVGSQTQVENGEISADITSIFRRNQRIPKWAQRELK